MCICILYLQFFISINLNSNICTSLCFWILVHSKVCWYTEVNCIFQQDFGQPPLTKKHRSLACAWSNPANTYLNYTWTLYSIFLLATVILWRIRVSMGKLGIPSLTGHSLGGDSNRSTITLSTSTETSCCVVNVTTVVWIWVKNINKKTKRVRERSIISLLRHDEHWIIDSLLTVRLHCLGEE